MLYLFWIEKGKNGLIFWYKFWGFAKCENSQIQIQIMILGMFILKHREKINNLKYCFQELIHDLLRNVNQIEILNIMCYTILKWWTIKLRWVWK